MIILYSVKKHEQIISLASDSVPTSLLAMNQTYVFLFTELTFSPNKLILIYVGQKLLSAIQHPGHNSILKAPAMTHVPTFEGEREGEGNYSLNQEHLP